MNWTNPGIRERQQKPCPVTNWIAMIPMIHYMHPVPLPHHPIWWFTVTLRYGGPGARFNDEWNELKNMVATSSKRDNYKKVPKLSFNHHEIGIYFTYNLSYSVNISLVYIKLTLDILDHHQMGDHVSYPFHGHWADRPRCWIWCHSTAAPPCTWLDRPGASMSWGRSSGWWLTYPSEKWWSESSVGMIIPFPTVSGKSFKIPWFQSPPTSHSSICWADMVGLGSTWGHTSIPGEVWRLIAMPWAVILLPSKQ